MYSTYHRWWWWWRWWSSWWCWAWAWAWAWIWIGIATECSGRCCSYLIECDINELNPVYSLSYWMTVKLIEIMIITWWQINSAWSWLWINDWIQWKHIRWVWCNWQWWHLVCSNKYRSIRINAYICKMSWDLFCYFTLPDGFGWNEIWLCPPKAGFGGNP